MRISVDQALRQYAGPALARLGYLFPEVAFSTDGEFIQAEGSEPLPSRLAAEIKFALYRERIYAETLPLRRALIDAVTRV